MMEGLDISRAMFGVHAKHVPAWMYVQECGSDTVVFVGASRIPGVGQLHPLRFDSQRTHQFVRGEVIVRPHLVVATDALRGSGLSGLAISSHDTGAMLAQGEVVIDHFGSMEAAFIERTR